MRRSTLGLLRCPRCGGPLHAEGEGPLLRFGPVRCDSCRSIFPLVDGTLDLLAEDAATGGEKRRLAQRALERRWVARLYERGLRRHLARFPLDVESEATLYRSLLAAQPGEPLLDLSCGTGQFARALVARESAGPVLGFDRSAAMLEEALHHKSEAGAPVDLVRADAHRLPLQDGSMGGVLCAASFHLYDDPAQVLREALRVLAPGRFLVVSTFLPPRPGVLNPVEARAGIHRRSEAELQRMALAAGFDRFEPIRKPPWIIFRARRPRD